MPPKASHADAWARALAALSCSGVLATAALAQIAEPPIAPLEAEAPSPPGNEDSATASIEASAPPVPTESALAAPAADAVLAVADIAAGPAVGSVIPVNASSEDNVRPSPPELVATVIETTVTSAPPVAEISNPIAEPAITAAVVDAPAVIPDTSAPAAVAVTPDTSVPATAEVLAVISDIVAPAPVASVAPANQTEAERVVPPETVAAAAKAPPPQPAAASAPPLVEERYLLQAAAPMVAIYDKPDMSEPPVARLEVGTQVEADARQGDWYRIRLGGDRVGWILNAPSETGMTLAVAPLRDTGRIDYQAARPDPRVPQSITPEKPAVVIAVPSAESEIERRRPQGDRIEPRLPVIDPAQVAAPSPYALREEVPVRDRWRIVKSLGLLPYNLRDPYNPNVLKGDLPVLQKELGPDWFFNVSAVSDTLFEARRLPTPVGAQSTARPGSNNTLGNGRQSVLVETGILSLSLLKGDTTFRPPDYEFRFVPVMSLNRAMTQEVRAVNINPATGINRNDSFFGVQELFVDKHLRDASTRYDFDSVRVGIQPFSADFRGFLFLDQPLGVRLFGTRDNNKWQYNLAAFRRLEKDTNSGLNDLGQRPRADDVYIANLYRQDWPILGFTTQGLVLHNRNREGSRGPYINDNGFPERPAIFGTGRPHNYEVTYLGLNGDGHFGRWNLTASAYYAVGDDSRGVLSGKKETINAQFGAFELSRDFDFMRVRLSGIFASGDKNPFDGKAGGFDAVLENPLIAGADTSYWIRQSIPLIGGGGTALGIRNGVLASLRTSREHGQSNFTNPGLHLLGIGADVDVSPKIRLISNLNYLEFDNLSSLATLRNQRFTSVRIGYDLSFGIQYRPLFTQNIVLNASAAALFPDRGFKELYGNAVDGTQYSALINLLLTF
jgi:hypothetical protein